MKQAGYTQRFLRKRKMLLIMPILVIPFITLAFWAVGGGKETAPELSESNKVGLNLQLPDAHLKEDKLSDKLSFYEKADKDSMKLAEWMRSDPYYRKKELSERWNPSPLERMAASSAAKHQQRLLTSPYEDGGQDDPEQKIMEKLSILQQEINKPRIENKPVQQDGKEGNEMNDTVETGAFSEEVDRLENMMQVISTAGSTDSTMQHLEKTLDKILDVQHPERVREKIKEKSPEEMKLLYSVTSKPVEEGISLMDTAAEEKQPSASRFYGIDQERTVARPEQQAIEAVVHENQVLAGGSIVKFRLLSDLYINGTLVSKGSFVVGIASLNNERLEIEISTIRKGNSIFPVKLEVYDLDGLAGIYIPGSITREVAKQSADNGLQLMEPGSMDPSFKAKAMAAGISAAKSLLSKKVKQVKVQVKAGYKVLIKDKNSQP